MPGDQGQVLAAEPTPGQQGLQRTVDAVVLGDHQESRGVPIEAMHNPGPP